MKPDLTSFLLFLCSIIRLSNLSRPGNSDFPSWPSHCCSLGLQETLFGSSLPHDAVIAGNVQGKRWGYAVDRTEDLMPMFMSEDYRERPVRASPNHHCSTEATRTSYDVLVNPYRCVIKWYITRYESEQFINTTGISLDNGHNFMPAVNGFYFARMENTSFGDLPSVSLHGETFGCRNETYDVIVTTSPGASIMHIDCFDSLRTMSRIRLVNITASDRELEMIRNASTVYFKRTLKNASHDPKKLPVTFSAMKVNSVQAFISEKFALPSSHHDSRVSFSQLFQVNLMQHDPIITSEWFMKVSNKLGIDVRKSFQWMQKGFANQCTARRDDRQEQSTEPKSFSETHRYNYAEDMTFPADSVTTITANSVAYSGTLRFTVSYELLPVESGATDMIYRGIQFFNLADRIEKTDSGTILVHFDGQLLVDSAHEVTVNVVSLSTDSSSTEPIFATTQTLFPAPESRLTDGLRDARQDDRFMHSGSTTTLTCFAN